MEYQGSVIGSVGIEEYNEERFPEFMDLKCREIGYVLSKDCWGQGLMPEAVRAVIGFLFDRVGYGCIQARHDANNPKSGRVMQKSGMTRVGILRKAGMNNQGLVDEVLYDMLPTDPRP